MVKIIENNNNKVSVVVLFEIKMYDLFMKIYLSNLTFIIFKYVKY